MTQPGGVQGPNPVDRWTVAAATLLVASLLATAVLLSEREAVVVPLRQTELGWTWAPATLERQRDGVGPVVHDFRVRLDSLRDAVAAAPDETDARLTLARTLHDAHRLPEAIAHYEILVAGEPQVTAIHLDLAYAHAQLGHWNAAAAIMERLLEGDPENAAILYNLGAISANRGDSAAATGWWNRMLQLDGESVFDKRGRASLEQLGHGRRDRS